MAAGSSAAVLAIVSKALFEKMVPKSVALGTVVDTDRYLSAHKSFDALLDGEGSSGSVFLVTVRPPDEKLWLVGILENVTREKGNAWVAKTPNNTPLTDITSAISKLKFEAGTGIKAKKGALGMSLQTPRVLTADDQKLLRGFLKTATSSGKSKKVSASAAYNSAVEDVINNKKKRKKKAPASSKGGSSKASKLVWRLDNYRRPFKKGTIKDLEPHVKQQLTQLAKEEGEPALEEIFKTAKDEDQEIDEGQMFGPMEVVDVVETKSDKVKYQFYLWPYGSGAIFPNKSTDPVANICQHGLDMDDEPEDGFSRNLAAAWSEGKRRLKIQEMVDFKDEDDDDS